MFKKNLTTTLAVFFLIFSFFLLVKPYLSRTFPYTNDGMNHLARFANYKIALREGQIPPRLAPNLLNRYGYPAFNYNYPLANILSLPFSILGFNYELTFKILVIFSLIFAGIGISLWLKSRKQNTSVVFPLVVFLTSPYLINLIFYRGNIGEILALTIFPWLLNSIEYLKNKKTTNLLIIFLWAAFFLSHNITVLFASILLIFYAILKFKKDKIAYWQLAKTFILATLLSFWFWLPALAEKNQIVLDNANLNTEFLLHFVNFKQLLFSPLGFGFSYPGKIDGLSFSVGLIQLVTITLSIILLLNNKKFAKKNKFLLLLTLLCLLFELNFTKKFWQIFPLVSFIQFPWRLTLFVSVLVLPLAASVWKNKKLKPLLLFIVLIQLISLSRLKPVDQFHYQKIFYETFPQTTSTQNENLSKTFKYLDFGNWQPSAEILDGDGEVKINYWSGSKREYQLKLTTSTTIVEPTMNYLGWKTWANKNRVEYVDSEKIAGRIAYKLEPGDYIVKTKFTQQTPARIAGNLISLTTLIICLVLFLKRKNA